MKRQPRDGHEISSIFPWFFWATCCNCGYEFRRERGWRAFTGPFFGGRGVFRHICGTCAPDREAAGKVIDSAPWIPPRPAGRFTPPPRLVRKPV